MAENVQISLNIEFEKLFESFLHSFSEGHILYTNMQKDVATKHSSFKAYNGKICINCIKYRIWNLVSIICAQFFTSPHFAYEYAKWCCDKI